jgi:hypothetical protein
VTHIKNKKNDVTNQKPSPRSTKTNTRLARTKCARKEKIVNGFFYSLYQILTLNVSDKSSCAMVKNKLTILAEQIKILPVSSASS